MAGNNANTKFLLHMDTDWADTSVGSTITHVPTVVGVPFIDVSSYKFAPASGRFIGGASEVTYPAHSDFALGTGLFAIDFMLNVDSLAVQGIANLGNAGLTGSTFGLYMQNNLIKAFFGDGSTSFTMTIGNALALIGTWFHAAVYRIGDDFYGALNGGVTAPVNKPGFDIVAPSDKLYIGASNAGVSNMVGNIDEFRITVGESIGTASSFPVPTEAYTPFTTPVDLSVVRVFEDQGVIDPLTDVFFARDAGIALAEFTATATLDYSANALAVTVSEIGNGYYKITFAPDADGQWDVVVTRDNGEKWWIDVSTLPSASTISYPAIENYNSYRLDTSRRKASYSIAVECNEITAANVILTNAMDYRVVATPMSKRARISVKRGNKSFVVYSDRTVIIECVVFDLEKLNKGTDQLQNNTAKTLLNGGSSGGGGSVVNNIQDNPMRPPVFAGANKEKK